MRNMDKILLYARCPDIEFVRRGKVRDVFDLGEYFLMVATDRLSAFDVVLEDGIPDRGFVLTQLSLYWFNQMKDLIGNHVVTGEFSEFPEVCQQYPELAGRSMIVKKAEPFSVECVVRGFLSGSGWKSYRKDETVCKIKLPPGLVESDKLPENIFTPSTKAEEGHDINISFEEMVAIVGVETAQKLRNLSLAIYERGRKRADAAEIIVADTKFEFGLYNGEIILIDELLTPDSSRFWPKATYKPGGSQKSYDKQLVRDWLDTQKGWDKTSPAPRLPKNIIEETHQKYMDAFNSIISVV